MGKKIVSKLDQYLNLDNNSIIHASDSKPREDDTFVCTQNNMDTLVYDAVTKDEIYLLEALQFISSNVHETDQQTAMQRRIIRQASSINLVDERTATGSTVLHLACQYGSIECLKYILERCDSLLQKTNSRGENALHLAARNGHYEVVVAIIEAAKSSLQTPDEPCLYLPETLIESLIRKPNVELETPLHEAVRYNHSNVVQLLVSEDPWNRSSQKNKHQESPLYLASTRCNADIIRIIISVCGWSTFEDGPDGRTALHAAVLGDGGHDILRISECVKLLSEEYRRSITVQDKYGWTVLHYVAYNNLHTIVQTLLVGAEKSVGYLTDNNYKRTALHVAAYKGNVRVMEKLMEFFPDCWEIVDRKSQNILHIAVEQNRKEVIRYILSRGCKAYRNLLVQRDKEGNTPLHLITKLGCYVQELMDEKAIDWEVLNNKNLTPLDLIHCGNETNTLTDQAILRKTLVNANVRKHWDLLQTLEEGNTEKANEAVIQKEKETKEVEEYKKWISTHMVVAALITTVALTAGFTVPGGFDGNQGRYQGSAILLKKRNFQEFIVADTIALLCSISSLFLYFLTTMYEDVGRVRNLFFISVLLNTASIITIMYAFAAGTTSVLSHSSGLSLSIMFISCSFVIISLGVFFRLACTIIKFLAAD